MSDSEQWQEFKDANSKYLWFERGIGILEHRMTALRAGRSETPTGLRWDDQEAKAEHKRLRIQRDQLIESRDRIVWGVVSKLEVDDRSKANQARTHANRRANA